MGQLLDICPKLRAQLNKALRLRNISHSANKIDNVVLHAISREDIATTECSVNGIKCFVFLDTCASINIVSRKFLNKLKDVKPFGYTTNNIIQVTTKAKLSSELFVLTVKIGSITVRDVFRVIDENHDLFDLLIGYKVMKENGLFINPLNEYLCRMNEDYSWEKIIPLSTLNGNLESDEGTQPNSNDSSLFVFH